MTPLQISIRVLGNSKGVLLPKPVLAQAGLSDSPAAALTVEGDAIVLRRPAAAPRTGWATAAQAVATAGDDELLLGEFANADDKELVW